MKSNLAQVHGTTPSPRVNSSCIYFEVLLKLWILCENDGMLVFLCKRSSLVFFCYEVMMMKHILLPPLRKDYRHSRSHHHA